MEIQRKTNRKDKNNKKIRTRQKLKDKEELKNIREHQETLTLKKKNKNINTIKATH